MAVIRVHDLRYRYPRQEALALDGISFQVEPGEFVGIVGPNRAGKSTLCQALVGLVPHFYKGAIGGSVMVAGLDVHQTLVAEVSRRAGLVFQSPFTQMSGAKFSVYEEVAFGLEHAGVPRDQMIPRIDRALRLLGLWELRERSPFALSGGQMQRLAIASVLVLEPQVLILDEPTSQLDPAGTSEVLGAVADLCSQGMAVVMAEHKTDRIAARADRVMVLHQGKMLAYGTPQAIFSRGDLSQLGVAIPPVTEASQALNWRLSDGTYPVTVAEAARVGGASLDLDARAKGASWQGPAEGRELGEGGLAGPMEASEVGAADPRRPGEVDAADPRRPGEVGVAEARELVQLGPDSSAEWAAPGEIVVSDLHFYYAPGTPVLKGLNLTIGPGAVAIIGQNGAGKSTFVRLLNGLLKPAQGRVWVGQRCTRDVSVAQMARQVGLVFQNPADQLFKSQVLDEVMFGPLNLGLSPSVVHERALAALEQVGVTGVTHRNPYDLGLAERKLVTVAGVLAMGTPVVILDEPTIAQDRDGVSRLGAVVTQLKAQGRTVITITHDMDFVARFCDRVLVFQGGEVLADDGAGAIFAQPDLLRRAGLEPPQITLLGQELGLAEPPLTVEAFVARVKPGR